MPSLREKVIDAGMRLLRASGAHANASLESETARPYRPNDSARAGMR